MTSLGEYKSAADTRAIFDYFLPRLCEPASVIEIGPGLGRFAHECRARKMSYIGIEPSRELCSDLEKSGFQMINKKVPPIPVEGQSFDLVHSRDFIEHLCSYTEVIDFLLESYRVLKPGGYTSVIAPNYQTIKHLFFQYEYQHSFITTKYRVRNMLMDCGFEIVKERCFLLWLSPKLNWLDRILAHTLIPISINSFMQGLLSLLLPDSFTFRFYKNLFDHVAILGRKPI